jgi:hypothetical protein
MGGWRIVEVLDVLSKTYGKAILMEFKKLKPPQPHAPGRRRRFYLAVLIGRVFCNFLPIVDDLLCYDKAL